MKAKIYKIVQFLKLRRKNNSTFDFEKRNC